MIDKILKAQSQEMLCAVKWYFIFNKIDDKMIINNKERKFKELLLDIRSVNKGKVKQLREQLLKLYDSKC
jgi:hypothetical protein